MAGVTEIEVARLLSVISVVIGCVALVYSVRSMFGANGSTPILAVLGLTAGWTIIAALVLADLTFGLKEINSEGRRYWEFFFLRVFTIPVSVLVMVLKWKNFRGHKPGLVSGPATMIVPVTIEQVVDENGDESTTITQQT